MEQKLDELLKQLHRYLFADSEQVIVELRHYTLDRSLKEADLAFVSSRLFNSRESLLQFLRLSCMQQEGIIGTVKKRLYELIVDYMKLRKSDVSHYLRQIKETCMVSFVGDANARVKEAAIHVLIKMIDTYNQQEIEQVIEPNKLLKTLLDEINFRRPSATVKGAIWTLIGVVHSKYPLQTAEYLPDSQKVLFFMLQEQVKTNKPEMKAIEGMLKGLTKGLEAGCELDENALNTLFLTVKTIIRPMDEVNNRGVMKTGMKLLATHAPLFTDQIVRNATDLIELALKLCVHGNLEVRDTANDLLGNLIRQISDSLESGLDAHRDLFRRIMDQFDQILNSNDYRNIQLLSAIRAVGIFSKAIQTILGDEKLWLYLERLTEISEQRLIKEFQDQSNPYSDLHNFKYILKKQKQLIAYIESYSFIIRNLSREPSEKFLQHFMKIGFIGVNNHRKLYNKYRFRFYEALAQLSMSLSKFGNPFSQWIKKFVRTSLLETLKIPDSVIFGGESPKESLSDAVMFWKEYLGFEDVWTEQACRVVYDELISIAIGDIEQMDLSYKVESSTHSAHAPSTSTLYSQSESNANSQPPVQSQSQDSLFLASQVKNGELQSQQSSGGVQPNQSQQQAAAGGGIASSNLHEQTVISYVANNSNDQQYFERLANFCEQLFAQSHDDWLLRWVPSLTQLLVKKATQTPRIGKLYSLLQTILQVCDKHAYFDLQQATNFTVPSAVTTIQAEDGSADILMKTETQPNEQPINEKFNTYSMLVQFLKEMIGRSEEFQDSLLINVMRLLLHVPIQMLHKKTTTQMVNTSSQSGPKNTQGSQIRNQLENLYLWRGVMIKALELSYFNSQLAMTCIFTLEKWFNALPVSLTAELYADVVPKLSYFLTLKKFRSQTGFGAQNQANSTSTSTIQSGSYQRTTENDEQEDQESYFFQDLIGKDDSSENKVDSSDIANKVLDLLGKIGGHAHSVISEKHMKSEVENFVRWDPEKRLLFTVPLSSAKIDIYLDACLPRIVDLAQTSTDKETRIAACELLHALILYMIGQSAQNVNSNDKQRVASVDKDGQRVAFARLYTKLFPVVIHLATEIEFISRQLFEPLVFQIVRWFAGNRIPADHPEVEALLDALIEGTQCRNNYALREMCSNAIAEFARWGLRFSAASVSNSNAEMTEMDKKSQQGSPDDNFFASVPDGLNQHGSMEDRVNSNRQDSANIRSLMRRIESNSNHPDPFKRLSSVLCFSKLFAVIQEQPALVPEFVMEISRCVLGSLKMCHNSLEFSGEVVSNCSNLLEVLQRQIIKHMHVLLQPSVSRPVHTSLYAFLDFLFSKSTSIETVYRCESLKLWTGLVGQLPRQPSLKQWILTRHAPQDSRQKQIFWRFILINFSRSTQASKRFTESKQLLYTEVQKQFDAMTAQFEFLTWLIKKANFSFAELSTVLKIDMALVGCNAFNLLNQSLKPKFQKITENENPERALLVSKEAKEGLIKAKICLLIQLFSFLNVLEPDEQKRFGEDGSQVYEAKNETRSLKKVDVIMLAENDEEYSESEQNQTNLTVELLDVALQILLIPAAHELQLLVPDVNLEHSLRKVCYTYIKRVCLENKISIKKQIFSAVTSKSRVCDLKNLELLGVNVYQPRLLGNLCNGLLKLANFDEHFHQDLIMLSEGNLCSIVESWSQSKSPGNVQSMRILVKFMSNLKIQNETLVAWLSSSITVYQKASDLILEYIAQNWQKDRVQIGEYLVTMCGQNLQILNVMIPILEHVSQKVPGYQRTLLKGIPQDWQAVKYSDEFAGNQVKIFSLIVDKCNWALQDENDSIASNFLIFITNAMCSFLQEERFQVYLKKSVLHLIGLLLDLKLPHLKVGIFERVSQSIQRLIQFYFPINTRDFDKLTNQGVNFEQILEGFLDLVDYSQDCKILRLLYRVLRENKPTLFPERIKNTVNNYVRNKVVTQESFEEFCKIFDSFMSEFQDRSLDQSLCDNIRWAIANRIISRILETCSPAYLAKLLTFYFVKFQKTLSEVNDPQMGGELGWYLLVREKTHIFLFLEIMIRRVDTNELKGSVTQQLYGKGCADNELTKYLIKTASDAKSQLRLTNFVHKCNENLGKIELEFVNSPFQVQRKYMCAAYTLLSSVILKTQKSERLFTRCLFEQSNTGNGGQQQSPNSMWESLVDCSSEEVYKFTVQTSFNFIKLRNFDEQSDNFMKNKQEISKDQSETHLTNSNTNGKHNKGTNHQYGSKTKGKAGNFLSEYITTSFMSVNEKFNSAMVFETQINQSNQLTKQQPLARISSNVLAKSPNEINLQNGQQLDGVQVESSAPKNQEQLSNEMELDLVNQHEIMKNLKRVLDRMKELFEEEWQKVGHNALPLFMQALLNDFENVNCHLNVKIFILKLLINSSDLFKPFARHWIPSVCKFMTGQNTGGKGFHYFMRDLATLLIQWNESFAPRADLLSDRKMCSQVVNTLIKMTADQNKLIFNINVEILATLMLSWSQLLVLDKHRLCSMLTFPEEKDGSHLWRMAAIQVVALACSFNIPLSMPQDFDRYLQNTELQAFKLDSYLRDGLIDPLFKALLQMQNLRKKQIIYASSEAIGKILQRQPDLVEQAVPLLLQNEAKDRDDIFVNAIERISRDFPELLFERHIFLKLLAFVNILTGSMRGAVYKSLDRFVKLPTCSQNERAEVIKQLMAVFDEILSDISEDNQQNFLILLTSLLQLENDNTCDSLLQLIFPRLKTLFSCNKSEQTRQIFYDLVVYIYDNRANFEQIARSCLLRGLADPSRQIRERLMSYWADSGRLSLNPINRLKQVLSDLYDVEEEKVWLTNGIYLLLKACESSGDFSRPILNCDLQCNFVPLLISQFNLDRLSRQQPTTSSVSFINQMVISASQQTQQQAAAKVQQASLAGSLSSLPTIKEEQSQPEKEIKNQKVSSQQSNDKEEQLNVVGKKGVNKNSLKTQQINQSNTSKDQRSKQNVVSASKKGSVSSLFTLSQAIPSSLVASHFEYGAGGQNQQNEGEVSAFQDSQHTNNDQNLQASFRAPNPKIRLLKAKKDEYYQPEQTFQVPISRPNDTKITNLNYQNSNKQTGVDSGFRKFFQANQVKYAPIVESQGSLIRCIPDGANPVQLALRANEQMTHQRQRLIQKQLQKLQTKVSLIRDYRIGDLPDIQIKHKDVLQPLMELVKRDSTIATEVFVELFTQIYQSADSEKSQSEMRNGVREILSGSILYDHGAVNCMHRVAIELLKIDQFEIDPEVIARTGKHSMSFQTCLNLLEELILKENSQSSTHRDNCSEKEEDSQQTTTVGMTSRGARAAAKRNRGKIGSQTSKGNQNVNSQLLASNFASSQLSSQAEGQQAADLLKNSQGFANLDSTSKHFWFKLVEMYELIGNQDALVGIRSAMGNSSLYLTQTAQQKQQTKKARKGQSSILSSQQNYSQSLYSGSVQTISGAGLDHSATVNLIKQAQDWRARGNIEDSLKAFEDALEKVQSLDDFEEQFKCDVEQKRLEALGDLLEWKIIAKDSLKRHGDKPLFQIPFQEAQMMVRSMLRVGDEDGESLGDTLRRWQSDERSKALLEQRLNFEQAVVFLKEGDFDRARFYVNQDASDLLHHWNDMTKLSQVAQHMLVQKVQKIYEMKEFLSIAKQLTLKGREEIGPLVVSQFTNWLQRQPSFSFDKLGVWEDILHTRLIQIDKYRVLFEPTGGLERHLGGEDQLNDLEAMLVAQNAKGAFKMGMYDSCERYLSICTEKSSSGNLRIVLPLVKLQIERFNQTSKNLSIKRQLDQLEGILAHFNSRKDQSENAITIDYGMKNKATLLELKISQKLTKLALNALSDDSDTKAVLKTQEYQVFKKLKGFIDQSFRCFLNNYKNQASQSNQQGSTMQQQKLQGIVGLKSSDFLFKAKLGYQFSKLTDRLLRSTEQNEKLKENVDNVLQTHMMKRNDLASLTIKLVFESINMGFLRASDSIPRILDLVSSKNYGDIHKAFQKYTRDTPAWIFLRWINQLIAIVNRPEVAVIETQVVQIARKYPQLLYYPFKVVQSNLQTQQMGSKVKPTQLFGVIEELFEQRFQNLNLWTESLDCLVDPEHRARYWLTLLYDLHKETQTMSAKKDQVAILRKANWIVDQLLADVGSENRQSLGSRIGSYNTQFAKKVGSYFSENVLQRDNMEALVKQLDKFDRRIGNSKLRACLQKLSLFSEYLDQLDNNDFYNHEQFIEIPGQAEEALHRMQEPLPGKNVKIASLKKEILILGSIKRPKRITVHGSNEKDYHLLIKGGEDLRLDQRVQQLFRIMNQVFRDDPVCQNRQISLKTFNVNPISNRLGSLEWVNHTEPLKALINREHMRLEQGKTLNESGALRAIMDWMSQLPENKKATSHFQQAINLQLVDGKVIAHHFKKHTGLMRWNLLRNGLESLCLNTAGFVTLKNKFIQSMAAFSICSYLIGVGDRHLDNFLVDITDGEVLGIDFGIAFGSGVHLATPELMPFRLTQQIEGVIAPHPLEGVYMQTMIHAMTALRKRKRLILDPCQIFVREPLLDWVKEAKTRLNAQKNASENPLSPNTTTANNLLNRVVQQTERNDAAAEVVDEENREETLEFYPRQKIQQMRDKLNGLDPCEILISELESSKHAVRGKHTYLHNLVESIKGPEGSVRRQVAQTDARYLPVSQQIECLVETARDPVILGRAWLGWGSYI